MKKSQTLILPEVSFMEVVSSDVETRKHAGEKIVEAYKKYGFISMTDHGLTDKILAPTEVDATSFFDLSADVKSQYTHPELDYQLGYTPARTETGEHFKIPDEKEFLHIGPLDEMKKIRPISEIESLSKNAQSLWFEFDYLSKKIIHCIALGLGLEESFFDTGFGGYSLLRLLNYPAQDAVRTFEEEIVDGGNIIGMCASAHTDINFVTLLPAREKGLQLFYEGIWYEVYIPDMNSILVNCGDMLQHITNGTLKSAKHRVVCAPGIRRFSTPFFYHLKSNFSIRPLELFGEYDPKYSFGTVDEYLTHRLKQLQLKK